MRVTYLPPAVRQPATTRRMFSPGPVVTAPKIPLYQLGWLGQDDGSGDGSGGAADFSAVPDVNYQDPTQLAPDTGYGPSPTQAEPAFYSTDSSATDTSLLPYGLDVSSEMPGTGQTVQELMNAGWTTAEIAAMATNEVPGTGQTMQDLLNIGYTPAQIQSMIETPAATAAPPAGGAGGSRGGGGSSGGGGGGGGAPTPKAPAASPLAPKLPSNLLQSLLPGPSPRVSSVPTSGAGSFLTASSMMPGVPNWALIAGGLVLVLLLGGRR